MATLAALDEPTRSALICQTALTYAEVEMVYQHESLYALGGREASLRHLSRGNPGRSDRSMNGTST